MSLKLFRPRSGIHESNELSSLTLPVRRFWQLHLPKSESEVVSASCSATEWSTLGKVVKPCMLGMLCMQILETLPLMQNTCRMGTQRWQRGPQALS